MHTGGGPPAWGRVSRAEGRSRSLAPAEHAAAREFVRRVRERVPAELVRAFLFGSKARSEARPDSDVDILLIFRRLPPDREPQAEMAEEIAGEVAAESGIPVTVWSVSLVDLAPGNRTPMLVDALDDGIPLWPVGAPPVRVEFGPRDALRCVGALLQRVHEGGEEVSHLLRRGDAGAARRRIRDDLVRLCTAGLLLRGETRPRRGEAVRRFLACHGDEVPGRFNPVLRWAARSYGPSGRDDEGAVGPPPGGAGEVADLIDGLRRWVCRQARALAERAEAREPARGARDRNRSRNSSPSRLPAMGNGGARRNPFTGLR
ncbi:MAG TPA: nucleotidyltransferase domain-containing protein [Longimicrobiaceae bacterium]|nr:nucleotidyltransferase domain-containing protein [Longimicrobiaceae bacterium]